jgi:hypothetical protein
MEAKDRFVIYTAARGGNFRRDGVPVDSAPTLEEARQIALRHHYQGKSAWVYDQQENRLV